MNNKILLNQARNLESDKSSSTIPIDLSANRDVIVDDSFTENVNLYNVYLDERERCSTVRLTSKVNLIASNILFNSTTEIVKNEGSSECECLNFFPKKISSTIGKPSYSYLWGEVISQCVMDTQITWDGVADKNYDYLCGIDIFNNHIIRAKSKKISGKYSSGVEWNTLSEYLPTQGSKAQSKWYLLSTFVNSRNTIHYQRKYKKEDVLSFVESIEKNLIKKNGWIGFINKSQIKSIWNDTNSGSDRVINNVGANRFIDLFPDRTRFDIMPHYNKYRNRYEKNWEYCLTYPSSSVYKGIPFIGVINLNGEEFTTLKIAFIDENSHDDDGVYRCTIYSASKHGLMPDDTINLYRSTEKEYAYVDDDKQNEIVAENLIVDSVIDDYTFTVYTSDWICKKWISVFDEKSIGNYHIRHLYGNVYTNSTNTELIASNGYINADMDVVNGNIMQHIGSQNLSFVKTVNNVKCKYYVRVFSRFPNFDFYDGIVNEENIYEKLAPNGEKIIEYYSKEEFEKQSTFSKLGFSKNIYGDNIAQIVYNDDIDISVLVDNLGRPLTNLYLTFIKTNYGYKEWYKYRKITSEQVEWSRCFGKLNCGFELSPYLEGSRFNVGNVRIMNNVNNINGLPQNMFWDMPTSEAESDEILYKNQTKFYGDLCMYSPSECIETSIQESFCRFNTAQREYKETILFNTVLYNEIEDDESYPGGKFNVSTNIYDQLASSKPEGYYYKTSYEIPIRSFSTKLYEFSPKMIDIVGVEKLDDNVWRVKTAINNYFNKDTNLVLYDTLTEKEYNCKIINIADTNVVDFACISYKNELSVETCKLYNKNVIVPNYAELVSGEPGTYKWREVVQNGFEDSEGIIPEYPFVNGCFYVNKDINIFVKRQDPYGKNGLATASVYFGLPQIMGEINPIEDGTAANANDAIKESDIKC